MKIAPCKGFTFAGYELKYYLKMVFKYFIYQKSVFEKQLKTTKEHWPCAFERITLSQRILLVFSVNSLSIIVTIRETSGKQISCEQFLQSQKRIALNRN